MGVAQACHLMDDRNRKGTVFSYLVATEPHWPRISSILHISYDILWAVFLPKSNLQDLWKRFQFVLDHNLGHFEANLFDRAEIVKEVGKHRRFLGTLERWTNHEKLVTKPDADLTSPLARVSLLASHEHLREKRRCLAGVQAIKSRFFSIYLPEIPIQYLYILSYSSITWGVLRCLLGFLALWGQKPCGGNYFPGNITKLYMVQVFSCYPSGTILWRTKAICSKRTCRLISISVTYMLGKRYLSYTIMHEC